MAEKKIIAVVGATGAQGGGLIRAILDHPDGQFAARAITRNPKSDKAEKLRELGAEVVEGNADDLESMKRAFRGAHGAFLVTNYWEYFSPERERTQAENMAKAAKEEGVNHVIWSTLEDTRKWVPIEDESMPTLMEKHKVPHFEGKAEADQVFRDLGVPTTFLFTSFYWENMIYFGQGPARDEEGKLSLNLPMGEEKLAGIAVEDIGKTAYAIFERGDELIGKSVGIAGAHLTGHEMADKLSRSLGEPVRYNAISPDVYRSFGFDGADDMGNMYQFYRDHSKDFLAPRDLEKTRALNPETQDFDAWLSNNADRIPIS